MAITQELRNPEAAFYAVEQDNYIINHLPYGDTEVMAEVGKLIQKVYSDNELKIEQPAWLERNHRDYVPNIWIDKMEHSRVGFINIGLWMTVAYTLSKNMDVMYWLTNPSYVPDVKLPRYLQRLQDNGYVRSYENVANDIFGTLRMLFTGMDRAQKVKLGNIIDRLSKADVKDLISSRVPVMGSKTYIAEKVNNKTYVQNNVGGVKSVVFDVIKHCSKDDPTQDKDENMMAKVCHMLAQLQHQYMDENMKGKNGGLRSNRLSAASKFSVRAVGTSIVGPHNMDDCVLSWSSSLVLFRPMLINKLRKRKIKYLAITKLLYDKLFQYDEVIHECLNELMSETRDPRGIPVIVHRNPVLFQGSILKLYVPHVKIDPLDLTVSLSPLLMSMLKGDFDGDNYNVMLVPDHRLSMGLESMGLHKSAISYNKVMAISSNISLTKELAMTFTNGIHKEKVQNKMCSVNALASIGITL